MSGLPTDGLCTICYFKARTPGTSPLSYRPPALGSSGPSYDTSKYQRELEAIKANSENRMAEIRAQLDQDLKKLGIDPNILG